SDVQHVHQTIGQAGDGFITLDAAKLPFVGPVSIELPPLHDLDGTQYSHDVACQPDFSVSPAPNRPQQRMVRNGGGDGYRSLFVSCYSQSVVSGQWSVVPARSGSSQLTTDN